MKKILLLAAAGLALVALAGLASFAVNPLLYSPANETLETEYHLNPDALTATSVNSTTDVYPVMQEMLDGSGDITMNIRIHDLDSAQAALADYRKYGGNLNHLVVTLDMNQSEVNTFVNSTRAQGDLFGQLINDTATLDALKDLEIQYQNSANPEMTASVKYQGSALRTRIHDLYGKYQKEYDTTMPISTRHGLNTTGYSDSLAEVQKIVQQADDAFGDAPGVQHVRAFNASTPFLTLAAYPREATYRDTIVLFGYLNFEDLSTPVTISLDNTTLMNLSADDTEAYHGSFTVETIPAGVHYLTARAANLTSVQIPITIDPVNSTTLLSVKSVRGKTAALCTGTVTANHPVRYAPYTIREKSEIIYRGTTDGKGAFNTTVPLFTGTHVLTAAFSSSAYPVNASESAPQNVTIEEIPGIASGSSGTWFGTLMIWVAVAVVLTASGAGAYWYLGRKKPAVRADRTVRYGDEADFIQPVEPVKEKLPSTPVRLERAILAALKRENLAARYQKLLRSAGLSPAARQVYLILIGRIAVKQNIGRYQVMTPTEFAGCCTGEGVVVSLSPFIAAYQEIRYNGRSDDRIRTEFETAMTALDRETKGDRH